MASKKSEAGPVSDDLNREEIVKRRQEAKENAVTQEGVTPPENGDINEPVENPETRP